MSFISSRLERTGDILKKSASDQITDYNKRFGSLKEAYNLFLKNLIVSDFDYEKAYHTANDLFGSTKVRFVAVDGTEYTRLLFDLVFFFGGAYASQGTIKFNEKKPPEITYSSKLIKEGLGISSCVPVYVNEIVEIDQTLLQSNQESQTSIVKPLTDESIVNNTTISSWIMTFSELYLAYKLALDEKENFKILLLDRSLTCMQTSLIYDTSNRSKWKKSNIHGLKINDVSIDINDLAYGRHRFQNLELGTPSPRGDYLRYAIIYLLEHHSKPLTLEAICRELGANKPDRRKRILRYTQKSVNEGYLIENDGLYSTNPRYIDTWNRLKKLIVLVGDQLFKNKTVENHMKIEKNGEYHWLTTQDIAFLTLFCLYMLVEECWNNKILLIGITKDTTSRDFKNQVIPTLINNEIWRCNIDQKLLSKAPNTDRMFLQSVSLFNYQDIKVPWSLIEYDSAFRTIIPDRKKRVGYVGGAIKNRIIPARLFLKTYIQLSQTEYDPKLRSNVLFIDRMVYPNYDFREDTNFKFKHDYGGATEPVNVVLFKDKEIKNGIQNLIMITLKAMTSPSIPEAFGHNKPLFIADKVCKWYYGQARKIIDTTGKWIMNNPDLRKFSFYMSTFRERRAEIEAIRRG